jgi:hypothetical protein
VVALAGCGEDGGDEAPADAGVRLDAESLDASPDDAGPGDAGPASCGDCGTPTVCAEPTCTNGVCDPGLLTRDLADDAAGDCRRPAGDGTSPESVVIPDDRDLPPEPSDPCGVAACVAGAPATATASVGEACRGQPGFCDGQGTGADSCKRCADTAMDPYEVDTGCTRVRSFCYADASRAPRGGCFSATRWDESWGTATFGTDIVTVSNLGDSVTNVRSDTVVSSGQYYWEIDVVRADPRRNGGGVGLVAADAPESTPFIGSGPTGVSFGYGTVQAYRSGWPSVSFPQGRPPVGSYARTGMTYMFALDLDTGQLWVGHAGVWYHRGDPATGFQPAVEGIPPRVRVGATIFADEGVVFRANFLGPFRYPAPAGFQPGFF